MDYTWSFRTVWLFKEALLKGTAVTVELTFLAILFGTAAGVLLAFGRLSRLKIVCWPSVAFIELFRALPLLVLLVWLYFCLPIVSGVRISAFTTAAIALSMNLAAFAAETFRAGIEAIPRGQLEVARTLGMTPYQIRTRIVLPQAVRQMMPALVGLYVTMLKLSSLASVIAVGEVLHAANNIIANTYRPLEVYTAIALIYVALVLPATLLSQRLENKALFARKQRPA